jgi:type-F conjugative transfer system pilin assembly protein TrbC
MAKNELLFTLKAIIPALIFFTAKPVFASRYPEISNQDREWVMNLATKSLNSVMEGIKEKYLEYQQSIDAARKQEKGEIYKLSDEKATLRVFVSSSMSEELLKSYVKAARRYNAILVFKGLPKGSWRELSRIVAIMNDNNDEIQIQLDDEAFNRFAVKSVPTFVLSKADRQFWQEGVEEVFDRVVGNIGISGALKLMAEKGDLAEIAREIMDGER